MTQVGPQTALAALESALVEEFRTLQVLVTLGRDERRALADGDWPAVEALLPRKAAAQNDLARLELARREALQVWAEAASGTPAPLALSDLLSVVEASVAQRLAHLRAGILSLTTELGSLNRGNRSLAALALERVAAVRDFLVDLSQPTISYQPFKAGVPQPGAALAVEQWA